MKVVRLRLSRRMLSKEQAGLVVHRQSHCRGHLRELLRCRRSCRQACPGRATAPRIHRTAPATADRPAAAGPGRRAPPGRAASRRRPAPTTPRRASSPTADTRGATPVDNRPEATISCDAVVLPLLFALPGVINRNCGDTRIALTISRSASGYDFPFVRRQREHPHQDIHLRIRGRPAVGEAGQRPGDLPRCRRADPPLLPATRRAAAAALLSAALPAARMTRSSTSFATDRYCSISSGESVLVYPAPNTSSGRSRAICGSTPNRSCSVLPYSTLFNRRMTNRPGSFGSDASSPRSSR